MLPRRGRGRRVASREPLPAGTPSALSSQPPMKEEGAGPSSGHGLFSYLREKEDEGEEDPPELRGFASAPAPSAQLGVRQPCPPDAHEILSYFKKEEEEEEEEGAEEVALSSPVVAPTYLSPAVASRASHPAGIEMLHFFTPLTHLSATTLQPKRVREREALLADAVPSPVPKKTTSAVWDYFTLDPREPCVAVCSTCQKRVRRGKDGGTRPGTTALHKHLKVHHGLHLPGVAVVPPSPLTLPKERPHAASVVAAEPAPPGAQPARQDRGQPHYPPTHPTALQLASDTAWMLAVDMQPYSYVEREGFRRLMATAQPRWKVPGRAFFATKAVPELSKAVSRAVRQAVACSVGRVVHITVTVWASRQAASYMSVTGHWIRESAGVLSRQHATLSVCAFEGPYSPEELCSKLREVLQDWLYDLKIGGVVSDDRANAAKAMQELQFKHISCLARCLKSVVKAFLAANTHVDRLLKMARRICSCYSRSAAVRRRLQELQANLGLNQQPAGQEAQRRANSTLHMLECLYRQRQAISAMLGQGDGAAHLQLTPADWKLVKCLVEILKPFEDAALLVTRPDATLCQALPLLWFLEEQLRTLRTRYHQENTTTAAHLTTQALECLESDGHLRDLKNSLTCRVAAFLDPRFRDITTMKLGGAEVSDVAQLKEHILDLATRSYVPPGPEAELPSASRLSPVQPNSPANFPGSAAWQFTMKRWRAITKSDPAVGLAAEGGAAAALREMEEYLHDNVDHVGEDADPMLYWQGKMGVWPALFKVAVFHFGCPPTTVSADDQSGGVSFLVDREHSGSLSPANLKMFAFIRKNRHLVPQDWRLSLGDQSGSQGTLGTREDLDMDEEEDLLVLDEDQEEK
uniref:BED-type domain-containing protein n=1 Tax=Salvator merianae TaxID=96440 RepID=A0A8D0DLH4_SALMN